MPSAFDSRSIYLADLRMGFGLGRGRKVAKPKHELKTTMVEKHWLPMARDLGRPGYHEAPGFADDRRPRGGQPWRRRVHGHERPYGPFSRAHWKYIRLAMRDSFLAAVYEATGATYQTVEGGDRRAFAVVTGITA